MNVQLNLDKTIFLSMVMGTAICKHALFRCVSQNEEMEENKNKLKHAESVRINKQINEDIKRDKKRQRNRYKLLMLGCGESGKVFIPIVKVLTILP